MEDRQQAVCPWQFERSEELLMAHHYQDIGEEELCDATQEEELQIRTRNNSDFTQTRRLQNSFRVYGELSKRNHIARLKQQPHKALVKLFLRRSYKQKQELEASSSGFLQLSRIRSNNNIQDKAKYESSTRYTSQSELAPCEYRKNYVSIQSGPTKSKWDCGNEQYTKREAVVTKKLRYSNTSNLIRSNLPLPVQQHLWRPHKNKTMHSDSNITSKVKYDTELAGFSSMTKKAYSIRKSANADKSKDKPIISLPVKNIETICVEIKKLKLSNRAEQDVDYNFIRRRARTLDQG